MNLFELSDQTKESLKKLEAKYSEYSNSLKTHTITDEIKDFWSFLQNAETMFFSRDQNTDTTRSEMEFGAALYFLNNEIPQTFTTILHGFGMPKSTIDLETIKSDFSIWWLGSDGTLFSPAQYAQLDPHWLAILPLDFYYRHLNPGAVHNFNTLSQGLYSRGY